MKNRGKRYSKECKRECIDYVRKNQDIPTSEAAENLGVPNSTLQRWVKQVDIDDGNAKTGELTSAERLDFQRPVRLGFIWLLSWICIPDLLWVGLRVLTLEQNFY